MSEIQPNPEAQEVLPEAAEAVSDLYMGDQLGALLSTQGAEKRDDIWNETAQEFPAFSEKIKELRERLKVIAEVKKTSSDAVATTTRIPFREIEDEMARDFLGDVFFSRMITPQKQMDNLNPLDEVKAMGKEMQLRNGWHGEDAKKITINNIAGSVLQGKLRITHQPK